MQRTPPDRARRGRPRRRGHARPRRPAEALSRRRPTEVGFAQTESKQPLAHRADQELPGHRRRVRLGARLHRRRGLGGQAGLRRRFDDRAARRRDLPAPRARRSRCCRRSCAPRPPASPVFLVDRSVDANVATAGEDYVTFMGSDFVEQGRRAAQWLVENSDGEERIVELEGTTGSSPANDRKKGFDDVMAEHEGMSIVASQSGDFARDKGRQVMETLLQAHPDVNIVYAHNDEMAIGAIQALEAAGRAPRRGRDRRLDRRHARRDAGDHRRQDGRDGRVLAVLRPARLRHHEAPTPPARTMRAWVKVEDRIFTERERRRRDRRRRTEGGRRDAGPDRAPGDADRDARGRPGAGRRGRRRRRAAAGAAHDGHREGRSPACRRCPGAVARVIGRGRGARADRSERRREVHADQDPDRRLPARRRRRRASTARPVAFGSPREAQRRRRQHDLPGGQPRRLPLRRSPRTSCSGASRRASA